MSVFQHFSEFLKDTDMLNHLDLSGLQLKSFCRGEKFQKMALCLNSCSNLLAVHLSDNDLIISRQSAYFDPTKEALEDLEFFEETLHIFGLKYIDIFPMRQRKVEK